MQRLLAIELKIGAFKPAESSQMEMYLRWLDRHERQPSDQAPLGTILCAGKKRETVEYLDLDVTVDGHEDPHRAFATTTERVTRNGRRRDLVIVLRDE
jgi:hypothetical protein